MGNGSSSIDLSSMISAAEGGGAEIVVALPGGTKVDVNTGNGWLDIFGIVVVILAIALGLKLISLIGKSKPSA